MERAALRCGPAQRCLEIIVALTSWTLITSPLWASVLFPTSWGWAFLAFATYWLYKSVTTVLNGYLAFHALRRWEARAWLTLGSRLPRWERLHHLVVLPTFREPVEILEESLRYLLRQDFPRQRIAVLVAFEARDRDAPAKARRLHERFGPHFGHFWTTFHPDRPGEVRGKSSNLAYAVPWAKRLLVDEFAVAMSNVAVTVCDADSRLHPKYLSALAHQYLTTADAERSIFQPAILFQANLHRLPGLLRALNGLYSIMLLARLRRRFTLLAQSTYSLGLETCDAVNYWDADVIPEDSHMSFKVFFRLGPRVAIRPMYLPVLADAAEGHGWYATLRAHYRQARRWAWGISDAPYVLWHGMRATRIPFWLRAVRVGDYLKEHLLWAALWFILFGGLKLLPTTAPLYTLTPEAALFSVWASLIFSASLPCLFAALWLDHRLRRQYAPRSAPPEPVLGLAFWFLLQFTGLVASVLPAVDAHTRLLLGRRLEYQVTEKLASSRAGTPVSATRAARGGVLHG